MKTFRCLLVFALVYGTFSFAKADPIDFHLAVLDPTGSLNYTSITDSSAFDVDFGVCPPNISAGGCFTGYNATTGTTFTSLTLSFTNNYDPSDPADQTDYLGGQAATCDTSSPSAATPSLFSQASCSLSPDNSTYVLDFSGAPGIGPGQFFFITETGPNPDAFTNGVGSVGYTPEPGAGWLLATAMGAVSLFVIRKRRIIATGSAF